MPKVTITDAKGLVQSKGSGVTVKGTTTFSGKLNLDGPQTKKRHALARSDLGASLRIDLSGSDTGKTWVLGDNGRGSAWTVHIPTASVGWTGRFMLTGSLTASSNVVITGSVEAPTNTAGDSADTPIAIRIVSFADNTATSAGITGTGGASAIARSQVNFVAAAAVAGDFVDVEVIGDGDVNVTGFAST